MILAVAAANRNPAQWQSTTGNSLIDFVAPRAAGFARQSAASTGKLALAVAAADLDPQQFAGLNLVISTTHYYNPATGAYGATVQDQALSMLGLDAAGAPIPAAAVQHLAGMANTNGGWGWTPGQPSDATVRRLRWKRSWPQDNPPTRPLCSTARRSFTQFSSSTPTAASPTHPTCRGATTATPTPPRTLSSRFSPPARIH